VAARSSGSHGRPEPIFRRPIIRGERGVHTLFDAVYRSVKHLTCMVLELDVDGRIRRVRPHFRPLVGTLMFTLIVGAKLVRHPGLFLRAAWRAPATVSRRT
jgi:hypothetical protein